ncbi:MAG: pantoate--beta-alanine ligase [Bacteroidales bacterium]|jgi:pantoate--beta-alanine ligase|nr:pantoate--beta-alanine ligase [Bacteroidales bacterium]
MLIKHTIQEVCQWSSVVKKDRLSIGFVPTMGALHQGHLSLIEASVKENDVTACSIFVNPIQFNNQEDLEKYPRTLEHDLTLLEKAGCNLVFVPSVEEMYPEQVLEHYYFGHLENVMEGAFRPGHFNGVAVIVNRLFNIVKPDRAYFGEKDFQQLAIIQELVKIERIPVEVAACPIVRESDGLAMSSRNTRLSTEERAIAPKIYRILTKAVALKDEKSVSEVEQWVADEVGKEKAFKLEYFTIVDNLTLRHAESWNNPNGLRGCVALWLGKVRLIDNISFS